MDDLFAELRNEIAEEYKINDCPDRNGFLPYAEFRLFVMNTFDLDDFCKPFLFLKNTLEVIFSR